jgi:hypothetical protein
VFLFQLFSLYVFLWQSTLEMFMRTVILGIFFLLGSAEAIGCSCYCYYYYMSSSTYVGKTTASTCTNSGCDLNCLNTYSSSSLCTYGSTFYGYAGFRTYFAEKRSYTYFILCFSTCSRAASTGTLSTLVLAFSLMALLRSKLG